MKTPTSAREKKSKRESKTSASASAARAKPAPAPLPLRPRPRLFAALMVIFAIWVAALLVMYFTTVYQKPEQPAATAPQ